MTDLAPPLALGDAMPDIALQRPDGTPASLHDVVTGRRAVVYFMRTSTCPVCHRHVSALVDAAEAGRLGGPAVHVLVPGEAEDAAHVRRRVTSSAVEVWATGTGHAEVGLGRFLALQHSGVFLLAEDGAVRYRRSAAVPTQSFDLRELLAAVDVAGRPGDAREPRGG